MVVRACRLLSTGDEPAFSLNFTCFLALFLENNAAMKGKLGGPHISLRPALEAINNLTVRALNELFDSGQMVALTAHSEIERTPVPRNKTGPFYRHFLPLQNGIVALLANTYRRYFKMALAHPREVGLGRDPEAWAWNQLQPAIRTVLELICDWYILACDGENQYVRHTGSAPVVPGQGVSIPIPRTARPLLEPKSWRAPTWLFEIGPTVGVGPLKDSNVPAMDSEEKLSIAHTRLLLKGARRVFLWELGAAIETVRNEEMAAAGAIPTQAVSGEKRRRNKRKGWEKREKLYDIIRQILERNPTLEGMKFCAELDKRHAPPHYDWTKRGERWLGWKAAWGNTALRRKIRRVRQEAMNAS
jgi:hypothetical protein